CGPRGSVSPARPGRERHAMPADNDLCFGAGAAAPCRRVFAVRRLAAENSRLRLRSPFTARRREDLPADRHGHDGWPGRVRCARLIRAATAQALHHAAHRRAFGRRLVEQPLMQNVLADLVLESEAATALALRLARAYEADAPDAETALARLVTPAVKYWVCKRAPQVTAEAMEVIGGNGYVEE